RRVRGGRMVQPERGGDPRHRGRTAAGEGLGEGERHVAGHEGVHPGRHPPGVHPQPHRLRSRPDRLAGRRGPPAVAGDGVPPPAHGGDAAAARAGDVPAGRLSGPRYGCSSCPSPGPSIVHAQNANAATATSTATIETPRLSRAPAGATISAEKSPIRSSAYRTVCRSVFAPTVSTIRNSRSS